MKDDEEEQTMDCCSPSSCSPDEDDEDEDGGEIRPMTANTLSGLQKHQTDSEQKKNVFDGACA